MALKERINDEMKAALLGGNRFVVETLRGLKAAILDEEVAEGKRAVGLTDDEIERIIAREIKKRRESASIYRENSRPELADSEDQEATVLAAFLPTQLTDDEVRGIVARVVTDLHATNMQDMGKVMSTVRSTVGTRADGATVADIVKTTLSK